MKIPLKKTLAVSAFLIVLASLSYLAVTMLQPTILKVNPESIGPERAMITADQSPKTEHYTQLEINLTHTEKPKGLHKINMSYGLNEADAWEIFSHNPYMQELHKKAGSEYIRVWVSCQWFLKPTFPLREDSTYDFTNLDSFIEAVISSNATPFIVFANSIEYCGGEGHGFPPPEDQEAFADYVEEVVRHYKNKYTDISSWYFEIWNEPYHNDWWKTRPSEYSKVFNLAYSRIKSVSPDSKVGGYSGGYFEGNWFNYRAEDFLKNTDADFISLHHFGNSANAETDEQRMNDIKLLHYDSMKALRELAEKHGKPDIEIINSEYSSDHTPEYMKRLDEPFTAAWYASALIAQIKSQEVSTELFYGGTSIFEDGGFGMWSVKGEPYPSFEMKKHFIKYNKKSSEIIDTEHNSSIIDVLAVKNDEGIFLTIINKLDSYTGLKISIESTSHTILSGLNSNHSYNSSESIEIILEPYEVAFFRLE